MAPTAMQMHRQWCRRLLTPLWHSHLLPGQPQRSQMPPSILCRVQPMTLAPWLTLLMHRTSQPWSAPASRRPLPPPSNLCLETRAGSRPYMTLPQLQAQPLQPTMRRSQYIWLALQLFRPHSRRATAQQRPSDKPQPPQPRSTLLLNLLIQQISPRHLWGRCSRMALQQRSHQSQQSSRRTAQQIRQQNAVQGRQMVQLPLYPQLQPEATSSSSRRRRSRTRAP